jgi:mRNA-degrading endonuclease toxin of MazEF toxin-antitoxin module
MPYATSYKQGEIILVPFPFTDLSSTKQRPGLIVSRDDFNTTRSDLLIAAITSQIPPTLAADEFMISGGEENRCSAAGNAHENFGAITPTI